MKGKGIAAVMAAVLTVSSVWTGNVFEAEAADNNPPGAPAELKTEMLKEAYGINTKNPAFSWGVNDTDRDEVQTAYRLLVSSTSALQGDVLDTGWVDSDENSYVHADALESKLEENELYYWQVQTKDKEGAEGPLSEAAAFMTNIGSEWASTDGIWATPNASEEDNLWSDYTVKQTMSVKEGGALGMLFRIGQSNKDGYMIQVRANDNVVKFHQVNSGSVSGEFAELKLADKGIKLPTDGSGFKVSVTGSGPEIELAFDTKMQKEENFVSAGSVNISKTGNFLKGMIGYRTGRSEAGTVDDLTVTAEDGTVLYQSDFSDEASAFSGLKVTDGKLQVGKSAFSIFSNGKTELSNFSFFRSPKLDVDRKEEIDKAIVSVSSRGTSKDRGIIFDVFMNGQCLGAGSARELANVGKNSGKGGYTQVYYNSYDVTDVLNDGAENVISAVGNCRDSNRGILVQMTLFMKDGTRQLITNSGQENSGWKTLDGTAAFGDDGSGIGTGYVTLLHENISTADYPVGFYQVDFDDSRWAKAKVTTKIADSTEGTTGRVLTPFSSENPLRVETNEANKQVYVNDSGNVVADLGKEIIGGMKVDITSAADQKVTVHMGEEMNADGTVKWQLSAVPDYEDVWTLQTGSNTFETVTMRTFRYVEFIGLDEATKQNMTANPDCVKGWAIQQEFNEEDSSFAASDGSGAATLLNRLWELSKYTIKATNQDLFVDSQARERAPYEGDLLVNSNTSYAVSGNYSLARHSNEWLMDNPTWPNDYRLFSVEMAYWDYIYTGNTDSVSECYEALKNKLTLEVEYEDASTGLIRANGSQAGNTALIDWPTSERDGYQGSYYDVVFNAEYVGIYLNMVTICEALGKTEDAAYYTQKSEKLKESLLKYAYDEENGCFFDSLAQDYSATRHSSTHATAYALTYGVFADQAMADRMCDFVYNKCKDEFKGSVYVTYFILKGLYVGNHGDLAEKLMTNPKVGTNVKTFASVLDDLNCTITPEAWGHKWKGNMTLSHPWGAAPGCSIAQGMFGILPSKAGFSEFTIKFQPGDITSASLKTPTVKGSVEASYVKQEDGTLSTTVTIPANTRAAVSLPDMGSKNITKLIVDGEAKEAERNGSFLTVELGSGTYTIVTQKDGKVTAGLINDTDFENFYTGRAYQIQTLYTSPEDVTADINEISGSKASYKVSDPSAASVTKEGVLTVHKAGKLTVTVEAVIDENTYSTSFDVTAEEDKIADAQIVSEDFLYEKDKTAVGLKVTTVTGNEYILENAELSVEDGTILALENNTLTALEGQSGKSTMVTAVYDFEGSRELADGFPAEKIDRTVLLEDEFEGTSTAFPGLTTENGQLLAQTGSKTYYAGEGASDWTDYTLSGTFTSSQNAANLTFRVSGDNTFYLWQFRTNDKTLKAHVFSPDLPNGYRVLEEKDISAALADGENNFRIIARGNTFITYLNGTCVNTIVDDTLPKGSIGIRNGLTESFYLAHLCVSQSKIKVSKEIEVHYNDAEIRNSLTEALESVPEDLSYYTEESAGVVETAKAAAEAWLAMEEWTQEDAARAQADCKALTDAAAALELREITAEELRQYVEQEKARDISMYAEDSVQDYLAAIADAEELLLREEPENEDIHNAVRAIEEAKKQFKKEYADLEALGKLVQSAGELERKEYYVSDLLKIDAAVKKAESYIIAKPLKNQQGEVDVCAQELQELLKGLLKKADTKELEEMIQKAESVKLQEYTDESAGTLTETLQAAKKLLESEIREGQEADIQKAVIALKDAMDGLEEDTSVRISDEETGITIEAGHGVFEKGVEGKILLLKDGEVYENVKEQVKDMLSQMLVFDIIFVKDGVEVQPNGTVVLQIPIPESFNKDLLVVYHLKDDKTLEKKEYQIAGDKIVLEADSFSAYVLGEKKVQENPGGTTDPGAEPDNNGQGPDIGNAGGVNQNGTDGSDAQGSAEKTVKTGDSTSAVLPAAGMGAGLLLIILAAWYLWKKRKKGDS